MLGPEVTLIPFVIVSEIPALLFRYYTLQKCKERCHFLFVTFFIHMIP